MKDLHNKLNQVTSPVTFIETLYVIPKIETIWSNYLAEKKTSVEEIRKKAAEARAINKDDKSVMGYEATYYDLISKSDFGSRLIGRNAHVCGGALWCACFAVSLLP